MDSNPFYHMCCVTGQTRERDHVKIEWHHNFTWRGKQLQEEWCILPICAEIHAKAGTREMKDRLDWIMLNRASDEILERYSKSEDLIRKRNYLNDKFDGPWTPQPIPSFLGQPILDEIDI